MAAAREILIGVTGGIAAYKTCDLIRQLKKDGFAVTVIMTKKAEKFVSALTFQTLSERKVYRDMFIEPEGYDEMAHISLAKKARLLVVVPATANVIGKIANGIADDLLTTTALSFASKMLIAPAMNTQMYENPIVQENIEKLKSAGAVFIGPAKGKLACGDEGWGCLAAVEDIIAAIKKTFKGA